MAWKPSNRIKFSQNHVLLKFKTLLYSSTIFITCQAYKNTPISKGVFESRDFYLF